MKKPTPPIENYKYEALVMDLFIIDGNGNVIGQPLLTMSIDTQTCNVIESNIFVNPHSNERH